MIKIASYILYFFLSPVNWIIILAVASYFFKKPAVKKYFRISAVCIFLLFSNNWLITTYAKLWQPEPRNIAADAPYSCAILLGGFASPDMRDSGYFNMTADRFIQAVKLYKMGRAKHILISGGNGKTESKAFSEGQWVKGELNSVGIPDSAILFEDRSANTSDNAFYSKKLLDSLQLKPPYLLVSSAHHLPRASLLFKKEGMEVIPFPCSYIAGKDKMDIWGIFPRPDILLTWRFYLKETIGYFLFSLKG